MKNLSLKERFVVNFSVELKNNLSPHFRSCIDSTVFQQSSLNVVIRTRILVSLHLSFFGYLYTISPQYTVTFWDSAELNQAKSLGQKAKNSASVVFFICLHLFRRIFRSTCFKSIFLLAKDKIKNWSMQIHGPWALLCAWKSPSWLSGFIWSPFSLAQTVLTWAIDLTDRWRDEDGNLNNWWSRSAVDSFQNLTKCFIDRYSSFQVVTPGQTAKVSLIASRLMMPLKCLLAVKCSFPLRFCELVNISFFQMKKASACWILTFEMWKNVTSQTEHLC